MPRNFHPNVRRSVPPVARYRVPRSASLLRPPALDEPFRDPSTGEYRASRGAAKQAGGAFLRYSGEIATAMLAFGFARWGLKFIGSLFGLVFGLILLLILSVLGL